MFHVITSESRKVCSILFGLHILVAVPLAGAREVSVVDKPDYHVRHALLHACCRPLGPVWYSFHEQLHNFNSQTANSLPNSLASFSENSLSQSCTW
jgi:hypothetical protein